MKKMLAIFFSLAISLSFGQNRLKVIDSLKNALAIAKLDTDRVLIKVGLAEMYALVNVDSALVYSESALDISRKISFIEGEAAAYDMLGWTFHNIGNHALSLDMYYKSLNFAEKNHLTRLKGAALMMIGLIYKDEYSDFDKALNYIYQAKALFTLIHYNRNITVCESMIGSIYTKKNQIDSAEFYLRLAETHEAQYNLNFNYVIWGYFALLYKAEGNPEKALEYLKQAAKLAYFNGDYANCSDYNIRIAEIYMGQNLRDSAIYFASRALEDTKKSISYPYIIQSSRILHTLYKDINPTKALYYNEITLAAEDSLYKSSKSNSLNNVIDFEEKEQEYEIEKSQKNYQSQVRLKLFLFGIGVFLLIGFISVL